ncbi:MAG TPA: PAS domain S-box protein [Pyrinomonadaceae bacterium]|nr:PAS domain S-box protein [Pyrinomonadaceae bacterium]
MTSQNTEKKDLFRRFVEINRALTTSLNFEEVLDLIVGNAAQLAAAKVCLLLLVDADEQWRVRAARGIPADLKELSGSTQEDLLLQLQDSLDLGAQESIFSFPVIAKLSRNGLLVLTRETPLTDDERWRLSALADQAAIALRNARLYESELAEAGKARDASEVARNLLAAIVESSDDAIVSKDLTGKINSWNKGAQRIFGYEAAEAVGRPITMLIPAHLQDEETEILGRIRRGERIDHFNTIRRRKDGTLLNISLTISPIKNERGEVIGASKIARDITDRERAEREIRFQANLLDAVEQAVIATDLSGTIIYWNSFAEKLYGWTAAEALGANVLDITPTRMMQDQADEILENLKKGQGWSGEFMVRRRDGIEFPAYVTDSPIFDLKGELIGIVGVSIDNTARRRAEEEREQLLASEREARAEAESANRLKDEFLATLSHELRNPLNVVIGYAEILRRSAEPSNPGFVIKAANVIHRNALAQSQLVSDLLDLSRLEMGKLSLNRQPIPLSTVINDAIETVREEASAKGVSVDVELKTEMLMVDGDPVRLGQIAWNLLNNAVKFTPAGGSVNVMLTENDGGGQFVVRDTGQGISADFLPHVFEIFRQGDASSVRRQGGMGIGLALVKQLVELHGGRVSAQSAGIGKGAELTVWLPQHKLAFTPATESTGSTGALKSKFILVVDDSSETTEMLGKLLELEGAFVETARSGAEALEIANAKRFDLVVSDISMPEMDGYQLLRKLRQLPAMENVPAVALTGYGRGADVERAHEEGFAEHLTKPLDLDKLLQVVRKLTE